MNIIKQTYLGLVKKTKQYWNPNENPTELDKYAFNLLDKAQVDTFINFMQANEVNIHVVDFAKSSLLIKAAGLAAKTNPHRKSIPDQQLERRAIKAVKYLLSKGVDINYQGKNGTTALLSASHWQHYDMVDLLIKAGADVNLGSNAMGFLTNPLFSAMFKKNMDISILLMQNNANPQLAIDINQKSVGYKLEQKQQQFLGRCDNIIKLTKRRFYEITSKKKGIISMCSDIQFQQICMNV